MSTKHVVKQTKVVSPKPKGHKISEIDDSLTTEQEFQSLEIHEHILKVPGMYIGGTEPDYVIMDVYDKKTKKITSRKIEYVPGLYKIFDEAIVNARDHSIKDPTMTELRVEINQEENYISIYNNGDKGIPVVIHADWDCYVPEGVFTNFMTSGNFHRKTKTVGAKNGYGVKLVSVMSSHVEIEVVDATNKKKFEMTLADNMYTKSEPVITNLKGKIQSYVKIKFTPDFRKFGVAKLTDDMVSLFVKRVYDIAAVTNVNVYLNNEKITTNNFESYIKMFYGDDNSCPFIYEQISDRWKVGVIFDSESGYRQVSYVNGICTFQGGSHVDHVVTNIVSKLHEVISAKNKSIKIKTSTIKDNLTFFIDSMIDDPDFPSQTKEHMNSKVANFGSKCVISDDFIKLLAKTGIADEVVMISKAKEHSELKVNNGKKKAILKGYAKLEDASNAGTKFAKNCTLILTEGDSAKPFAVAGAQKMGQENYGVFPLKGKLLNVREATNAQLKNNEEIKNIVQIMGLKYDHVYEDVSSLRYGKIMILTDQDLDGSHIKGLVMNFIEFHWPSLAKIEGFIMSMKTPLLKIWKKTDTKKLNPLIFYSAQEYDTWKENNNSKLYTAPKYYKGLGTSTVKEAGESFVDFENKKITYGNKDVKDDSNILKSIFSKDTIDFRKDWLRAYNKDLIISPDEQHISYTDFVNKDLIHYSNSDIIRSIPSICDGFKPSLRKILFGSFLRNIINIEIRVAQLSGFISDKAAYHHGEASLQKAIVGMAQNFVGANNISWLLPNGMFGDRSCGGNNPASARYINTQINQITVKTFKKEDRHVYKYAVDDNGLPVEPETYAPIICNVLVNGANGIGTGFSTKIPCYNPLDIIKNQKLLIAGKNPLKMIPWYKGFKGAIVETVTPKSGQIGYDTIGLYEIINENTLVIEELPIGLWTDDYKKFLDDITCDDVDKAQNEHLLKMWVGKCGNNTVHFTLTFLDGKLQDLIKNNSIEKKLDLIRKLSVSNMHLYNSEGKLTKYENVESILREYYEFRMNMYVKRKEHYTQVLENKLNLISWKVKFIQYYIDEKITFTKNKKSLSKADVEKQLIEFGFPRLSSNFADLDKNYDYLTDVKIFDLTIENKNKLTDYYVEIQNEYDIYVNTTVQEIWLSELDEIEKEFVKQMDEIDDEQVDVKVGGKKKRVVKKKIVK